MEIHGTKDDSNIPSEFEGVDRLREATFILTPSEMEMLAKFFAACARDSATQEGWEHEHLQDYLWEQKYSGPDVVVYRK